MSEEEKKNQAPEDKQDNPETVEATTEETKATEETTSEAPAADTDVKTTEEEAQEREEAAKESIIPEEIDKDVEVEQLPNDDIETGMLVRVHEKIKDVNSKGQEKERVQIFEGLVIGTRGSKASRTMTVRKNSKGWMVEKIFPLSSPNIDKVEVVKKYRVRRAKLSYLRGDFKRKLREIK